MGSRKDIRNGKGIRFKFIDNDTKRHSGLRVSETSDIKVIGDTESFIKYILENEETGLSIRYTNTNENRYKEIRVPNGTKKLKKSLIIKRLSDFEVIPQGSHFHIHLF